MKEDNSFANFKKVASEFKNKSASSLNRDEMVKLICGGCRYYHKGEKKEAHCAAFNLLSKLIRKGEISLNVFDCFSHK